MVMWSSNDSKVFLGIGVVQRKADLFLTFFVWEPNIRAVKRPNCNLPVSFKLGKKDVLKAYFVECKISL